MRHARKIMALCTAVALPLTAGACGMGMGGMGGMSPEMMTHARAMSAFAAAVHMGEIEEAQLALSNGTSPQVRQYAERMIADHTPFLQQEHQLLMSMQMGMDGSGTARTSAAGMTGAMGTDAMDMTRMREMLMANPASRPVVENHMQAMTSMRQLRGAAFDRMYMERQAVMHRYTLEQMDRMMMSMGMTPPAAGASGDMAGMDHSAQGAAGMRMRGHSDMMALHMKERAAVAMHLQMAQQMTGTMR